MNYSSSVGAPVSQPIPIKPPQVRSGQVSGAPAGVETAPVKHAPVQQQAAVASARAKIAPTPDELKNIVNELQSRIDIHSSDLQFSVDQDSGKAIVKVTDRSTKDVIWQFPSEEALQVAKELDRFQQGLLVNRKA
jgi:flagellar protein FlaG